MARIAGRIAAAVAAATVLTSLTGGVASAEPTQAEAFPGMRINFDGQEGWYGSTDPVDGQKRTSGVCTLGVVGTDSAGRKVGITAGHCNPGTALWDLKPKYPSAPRGQQILDNGHPVFNTRTTAGAEPIGWIRWVDADTCDANPIDVMPGGERCVLRGADGKPVKDAAGNEIPATNHTDPDSKTDYMVIEFAPHVRLTSQVKDKDGKPVMSTTGKVPLKVNSIYRDASGAVAVPSFPQYVENFGSASDRRTLEDRFTDWGQDLLFQASAPDYGIVGPAMGGGLFRSWAASIGGDSGGPVVLRGTGKWAGIISASDGTWMPWVNTSAKNILADLNPRGVVGSGFTPIND